MAQYALVSDEVYHAQQEPSSTQRQHPCQASRASSIPYPLPMKKLKITEIERLSPELYTESPKLPIVVVLDDVRSMNNVGSVFRSCDAFRIEHILLCGITATPPHPDIHKTALGAELTVPWSYYPTALEAIEVLSQEGYEIYALEQASGSISMERFQVKPEHRYALVLGNEVHGVHQEVLDRATGCLEIPQYGTKHSLNVSVAAGIALWQMAVPLLPSFETDAR